MMGQGVHVPQCDVTVVVSVVRRGPWCAAQGVYGTEHRFLGRVMRGHWGQAGPVGEREERLGMCLGESRGECHVPGLTPPGGGGVKRFSSGAGAR